MSNVLKCDKCDKKFKYKSHLTKHLNRKVSCSIIENFDEYDISKLKKTVINISQKIRNKINKSSETFCYFCNKTFSTRNNLTIHISNNCSVHKQLIEKRDNIKNKIINIRTKNKELDNNKILNITNNNNTTNNTTNNITNNISNTINIQMNNYGNEDLSHITDKDYKQIINTMFKGFIMMIEQIHFNDNKPENFNIYLSNLKNNFAHIYKNDTWKVEKIDDVIDKIKDDKISILNKKVNELKDDTLKDTLETFKDRLYYNPEAEKNTNDDIKYSMYNNRDKVLKYKKKLVSNKKRMETA